MGIEQTSNGYYSLPFVPKMPQGDRQHTVWSRGLTINTASHYVASALHQTTKAVL